MTKKDYIKLAEAIAKAHNSLLYATVNKAETDRAVEITALTIANALYRDNKRFDEGKFMTACGFGKENDTLECTVSDCENIQLEGGEFCEEHSRAMSI